MKFILRSIALAGSIAIGATAFSEAVSAEQVFIRFGTGHPLQAVEYNITAHEYFVPELKRRAAEAGYDLEIQELYGGTVARVTEIFDVTRDGLLDMSVWGMPFHPTQAFMQSFQFYLPFNSPDPTIITRGMRKTMDAFPRMREVFKEEHNQKFLGVTCVGNYGLGTNFAWDRVEQLEGRRIAGAGANLNWIVGATPVASNLNDAYQAIQTGVYDGYIIFPGSWYGFSLHEVGQHFMKTDFGSMAVMAVSMNLDKWNSLSADLQQIIQETVIDYELETAKLCHEFSVRGEQQLRDAGVTVKTLSDEEKTNWCERLKDWPGEMARDAESRGWPAKEIMTYYIETIAEMGHTFPCEYDIGGS